MKTRLLNFITFTIAFVVVAPPANSAEHAASLEAHVHGLSELTVAMEGEILEIQLTSPAMNLVGFEHKASTKEHIAAVESAESRLRKHETLFLFSEGGCEHVKTSIDVSGLIESDNHEHTRHKNSSEHEYEDEHKHEHDDHAEDERHSDIVANYQYRCGNKSTLSSITVNLFKSFPSIQKVHVMWVKPTQQGAVMLTAKNRMIEFK